MDFSPLSPTRTRPDPERNYKRLFSWLNSEIFITSFKPILGINVLPEIPRDAWKRGVNALGSLILIILSPRSSMYKHVPDGDKGLPHICFSLIFTAWQRGKGVYYSHVTHVGN